jgi:hypothetical protein
MTLIYRWSPIRGIDETGRSRPARKREFADAALDPFKRIAARFRDHARECRDMVEGAESDEQRELLDQLVDRWQTAADLLERFVDESASWDRR